MFAVWVDPSGDDGGEGRADLTVRSLEELRELWAGTRR
jgi:hypothetical protein